MAWIWGTSPFDDTVEKATSELNIAGSEDIALNLEICDQIRSKAVVPKEAMRAMKRRLSHQNPNVQLLTLTLLDVCIKNGGDHFLVEIASREFMDNMVSLLKQPTINREVKDTMLRLTQNWATAFEGKSTLSYVGEVYKTLQQEGFKFPPKDSVASSMMVDTATAPEWVDSDVCLRCRTAFSFTNRKHHCRNCGQVYDQACSSRTAPLPHFGITEPVRVCESCFAKLKKKTDKTVNSDTKLRRSHSAASAKPPRPKSLREQAEEDLQKAIALSLQESKPNTRAGYVPSASASWPGSSEPPVIAKDSRPSAASDEEDDPELRAAIEASLREAHAPKASAPDDEEDEGLAKTESGPDLAPLESDAIMTFSQTIEEAAARGTRDLVRYPGVGELFNRAEELRPKLETSLEDTNTKQQTLSDMHEKLSEAVKLYDRLLTAQISDSSRRYAEYARAPTLSYQASQPQPQQQQPSHWSAPPQQHQQSMHQWGAPPQAYAQQPPPPQAQYSQQQYPGSYVASPSATPVPPQSATQWNLPQSPPPVPNAQTYSYAHPATEPIPTSSWAAGPPPPPQAIHSPYPQQQQSYQSVPPTPSSPSQNRNVAPANPIAQLPANHQPPTPSIYPSYNPQQPAPSHPPQQAYAPPPSATPSFQLPNFPSAPTAAPQPYAGYAPPEQTQQKEAMLISFD